MQISVDQIPNADPLPATAHLSRALHVKFSSQPHLNRALREDESVVEVIVGDGRIQFAVALESISKRFTLPRQPPREKLDPAQEVTRAHLEAQGHTFDVSALRDGALTIERPGVFVVRTTIGSCWHRDAIVAVFPKSVLDHVNLHPSRGIHRRNRLRNILRDPRVTLETLIKSIESGDPSGGLINGVIVGADRKPPPGSSIGPEMSFGVDAYGWE